MKMAKDCIEERIEIVDNGSEIKRESCEARKKREYREGLAVVLGFGIGIGGICIGGDIGNDIAYSIPGAIVFAGSVYGMAKCSGMYDFAKEEAKEYLKSIKAKLGKG